METVSLKMDSKLLTHIDKNLEENDYSTRTEFIRDAIRHKLDEIEKKKILEQVKENLGSLRGKRISNKDFEQIREEVARGYAKKFGINLD